MDSLTGFDDDQDFFGSYDAEGMSLAPLVFDDAEAQPPTPEQLAHLARFRKPVALVVASMALLSVVALGVHGSQQHSSQRELVAYYSSAVAAPTLTATASVEPSALVPEASPSSSLLPEAWSALLAEAWSALVPDASAANATTPVLALRGSAPALEPAAPLATLSESSSQPDSSPVSAFIAPAAPICLLPEATRAALDQQANTAGARPPLTTTRSIFLLPTPARANPAPFAAATPPTPFDSVARFPDVRR